MTGCRVQRHLRLASAAAGLVATACASAQMHRVEKPETVVRAVGVYEWVGELAKPAASRLIPVTVFINGELEDGAIFQPRPIPFALTPGNEYELQQAGLPQGLVELHTASKQADADIGNVDGWWGHGVFEPPPRPKTPKLQASRKISPITTAKDDGKPALADKNTAPEDPVTDPPVDARPSNADADRPTLRRRSTTGANKTAPAPTTTDPSSTPPDDPDRPTLKHHDSAPPAATNSSTDQSPEREIATGSLNNDPNRPILHRGQPTGPGTLDPDAVSADPKALASLAGLPENLHQMVAVSDAASRPEHDFARPWADDAEHKSIQTALEAIALARLSAYTAAQPAPGSPQSGALVGATGAEGRPVNPSGGPAFTPASGSAGSNPVASGNPVARPATPAARRRAAVAAAVAKKKAAAAASTTPLLGEDLHAYTLSYGGAPTFVLTAHTGAPGAFRYVTVVAQQDTFGKLQTAFSSVTDSAHLDRTPWMRLVGVVDAQASNRASLLFELREGAARQFALYRVLSGRSENLFTTGLTQ